MRDDEQVTGVSINGLIGQAGGPHSFHYKYLILQVHFCFCRLGWKIFLVNRTGFPEL